MVPAIAGLMAAAAIALPGEVTDFLPGEMLEFDQRADETRSFRTTLEAGRAYVLEVGQRELDVIVEIVAPDGTSRSFDAPLLRFEPERLLIEPEASGTFLFSLSSREYKGGASRVTFFAGELPLDHIESERRRQALADETRGAESHQAGGSENWQIAVDAYRSAATTWSALAERSSEARARLATAWLLYSRTPDWRGAVREAEAAAVLYEGQGNRSQYASALHVGAAGLIEAGELDKSLETLEAARQVKVELGESYENARIVNEIGVTHYRLGNLSHAQQYFGEAAKYLHAAEEWAEELKATANLAAVDYTLGHLAQALQAFQRTLDLVRPGELSAWRGDLLNNMGAAHQALGNADSALAAYARALDVHEEHDSLEGRGRSLSGIGVTYYGIGELDRAREYLERALPVRREARDKPGQVSTLLFLGGVYLRQGEIARAVDAHREAVELGSSPRERARAQVMLGRDLAAAGHFEEALQMLLVARNAGMEAGTPVVSADALLARGEQLTNAGRVEDAMAELKQALEIYEEFGWLTGEAQALYQLARATRAGGDLEQASEYAIESIRRTEQLRSLIANPELRASFLATRRNPYSLFIDLAMELASRPGTDQHRDRVEEAFSMSERARTRAALDLIQEASSGMLHMADAGLVARRRELYEALAGLRFRQMRLLERERDPAPLEEVRAALDRVETELQVLESELRKSDPRHASLTAPEPLAANSVQAALDADSVLLQYELGDDRSWLFVVTTDTIDAHAMPPRAKLEAKVRDAYRLLKTLDSSSSVRGKRNEVLAELSRLLLGPARPLKSRIVLAVDGALHYLPFAALPLTEADPRWQPLIVRHELVSVPSISMMVSQRSLQAGRRLPSRTVAVFADPVFEADDPRLSDVPTLSRDAIAEPDRLRAAQWMVDSLRRLPATGAEADAIATLVDADERLVATGLEASRSNVLGTDLGAFRILHFATHAFIDDRYPALSALALSRFDESSAPVDGFLRLHDVYDLELHADLVALSACETALGRELRGEGLLGLTRAFQHAGARSVVASLWQVPDRATAELMRHFYERQLRDGLSPAAALRQAQLAVSVERRWSNPYFWSAFVAYGEWQPSAWNGPSKQQISLRQ